MEFDKKESICPIVLTNLNKATVQMDLNSQTKFSPGYTGVSKFITHKKRRGIPN
jgi:hypothetical protein